MKIIDLHCDALFKMQEARQGENISLRFRNSPILETNFERLQRGNVFLQFFAIFLAPNTPSERAFYSAKEQIELFQVEVLQKNRQMRQIKHWSELSQLEEGEIGAVLTLEGAEAFGNDLSKLHYFYEQGIKIIGLTWNNANLCADGVGEKRGAGLTELGKKVVYLNNKHQVFTDVSHIAEKGFWDVMELAKYPIASHSNAFTICAHPRNLTDEQIKVLLEKNGLIHVVFYPPFIHGQANDGPVEMAHLINHIDHLCSLGGEKQIGFGSDFDGIDSYLLNLENASMYHNLINALLRKYSEEQVRGFAHQNFLNYVSRLK